MNSEYDGAMVQLTIRKTKERNRREIERAIDRLKEGPKPSEHDRFRRQWYRAAWQRDHRQTGDEHEE